MINKEIKAGQVYNAGIDRDERVAIIKQGRNQKEWLCNFYIDGKFDKQEYLNESYIKQFSLRKEKRIIGNHNDKERTVVILKDDKTPIRTKNGNVAVMDRKRAIRYVEEALKDGIEDLSIVELERMWRNNVD
jgi:hypothetical protein